MKKLLALMLVLGMTSLANAALVLSINGQEAPDEITLVTSETITIDLHLTAAPAPNTNFAYDLAFQLSNAQAAFDWSKITFPTVYFLPGGVVVANAQYVRVTAGQFPPLPPIAAPAVLVDKLFLHCEEATPVVLDLVVTGTTPATQEDPGPAIGTILDSVVIHQVIPEPATMLLLGLGGLFLRRRKK